jgi:hypothetical protein
VTAPTELDLVPSVSRPFANQFVNREEEDIL